MGRPIAESWGPSTVPSILTGAAPLKSGVNEGLRHHRRHLVPDGVGGFHRTGRRSLAARALLLDADVPLRLKMSRAVSECAREVLCDAREHRQVWLEILEGLTEACATMGAVVGPLPCFLK